MAGLIFDARLIVLCAVVAFAVTALSSIAATRSIPKILKLNFSGKPIPVVGGFAFLAAGLFFLLLSSTPGAGSALFATNGDSETLFPLSSALIGFGLLGLFDDLFGDRSTGGFKGHFRALVYDRRATTGLIKAIGGGCLALAIGYLLSRRVIFSSGWYDSGALRPSGMLDKVYIHAPVFGLFIALAANANNLVDLRPGRAASFSLAFLIPLMVLPGSHVIPDILIGTVLPVLFLDRSGKVMLGDCGSNSLGAAIGFLYCCALPFWGVCIGVVALGAFNFWCEKHSVNRLIEETPWLRALDRKIGVR